MEPQPLRKKPSKKSAVGKLEFDYSRFIDEIAAGDVTLESE